MIMALLISCAVVLPIPNKALVLQSNGQHYWVTYQDQGDRIVYGRPVHAIVKELVENRQGQEPRLGCESFKHPLASYL